MKIDINKVDFIYKSLSLSCIRARNKLSERLSKYHFPHETIDGK